MQIYGFVFWAIVSFEKWISKHIISDNQLKSMPKSDKSTFSKMFEVFEKCCEESNRKCSSETKTLRNFVYDSTGILSHAMAREKYFATLMEMRIVEVNLLMIQIVFLSLSGMYRSAFHNIRYILESVVQSVYIDSRHKNSSLRTKIEILKEVEDKRDYRVPNLISKLENLGHKEDLAVQYKRLSQMIHPSHRSVIEVLQLMRNPPEFFPIDCKEISEICEALKITTDMILFLFIWHADESTKERLQKNTELIEYCKKYNMFLLSRILKGKIKAK